MQMKWVTSKTIIYPRQRFGYFSIIYSPYIGDKYYSQAKERTFKRDGKKIITEKRGVFTSPPKTGKNTDAMFTNIFTQDEEAIEKLKQKAKEDHQFYMKKVKERADKPLGYIFKPTGPQDYKDL